jgi:cyclopropane-fatty-acyl-phospholipid synthase
MSARVLNRFLERGIKRGRLEVTYASGEKAEFGEPAEGFPEVALRFTDRRVPRDILLDPRIGAGEAYMNGRIVLEKGGIMELVQLMRMNRPW